MNAEFRRLHPLSPLLRGVKMLGVVIAALSWQGFARFGIGIGAAIVAGGGLAAVAWSWVAWHFTGFNIAGRELHITEGVLVRRQRTIPLERLQSVEVVQPLLARPLGLAELRCEVVGASKTEAPLSYLTLDEAHRLRGQLLELSKQSGVEIEDEEEPAASRALLSVPPKRLVAAQLLTPQVFALPLAVAFTIVTFVWNPDVTFFGIAGLITAMAGILLRPVREAMTNYDFTLDDTPDGLRVKRGLTERHTRTLPFARVTAAMIQYPLLWRGAGWARCRVANAGGGGRDRDQVASGDVLLPVGDPADARLVTTLALSGVDMTAARLSGVPRRARWCAPLAQPILGATLDDKVFIAHSGRFTRTLVAVPYARIQSVRVTQGRVQRWLRLATVHADIAGGTLMPAHAAHRDVAEALDMARRLRERARAAAT
ncbi:MAG TPA: PH domain-containing protein [Stackebrandtia sp.]|uniref:PH domain-containing protein n=1 Tax=Stackebrandtia sp. TaxID=2023065 RepID=UPI002D4BF783|nr:PH domain-containing protein [Stackebrandtia sp.]HZE38972.1 PH domain-containing protein [Stackebrandtia sp.]